jgi:hypothetical protein
LCTTAIVKFFSFDVEFEKVEKDDSRKAQSDQTFKARKLLQLQQNPEETMAKKKARKAKKTKARKSSKKRSTKRKSTKRRAAPKKRKAARRKKKPTAAMMKKSMTGGEMGVCSSC